MYKESYRAVSSATSVVMADIWPTRKLIPWATLVSFLALPSSLKREHTWLAFWVAVVVAPKPSSFRFNSRSSRVIGNKHPIGATNQIPVSIGTNNASH